VFDGPWLGVAVSAGAGVALGGPVLVDVGAKEAVAVGGTCVDVAVGSGVRDGRGDGDGMAVASNVGLGTSVSVAVVVGLGNSVGVGSGVRVATAEGV
jgi:hypothetical protein